ncbi:MAG: hypothetical protein KDA20_05440 [Phycisphaerales bacterium]|nr:hypothetical protein [Phycisphaerales bacterium]
MRILVQCGLCMVALAPTGLGQHFGVGIVDASDGTVVGGVAGTGINIASGEFFQHPLETPGIGEPNQAIMSLFPELQYDTYLTVDSGPVETVPGYDGSGYGQSNQFSGSPGFTASTYRGVWAVSSLDPPESVLVDKPGFGQAEQLFLGRLTYTGVLQAAISVNLYQGAPDDPALIVGDVVTPQDVANGIGWIDSDIDGHLLDIFFTDYRYAFVQKNFNVDIDGTTYTVSDIYLQSLRVIPAPSSSILGCIIMYWSSNRRRRLANNRR